MKRKVLIMSTLISLTAGLGMLLGVANQDVLKADATEQKSLIVRDNFNDSLYADSFNPSKWSQVGEDSIKQTVVEDTFFLNDGSAPLNGEHLFLGTKRIITNLEYFQFDIRYTNGGWISVKFFKELLTKERIDAAGHPLAYNGPTVMTYSYMHDLGDGSVNGGESCAEYSGGSLAWGTGKASVLNDWITIRFEPISATKTKAFVFNKGEAMDSTKYMVYDLKNTDTYDFKNCQVGIQSENGAKFAVDNFRVKAEGQDEIYCGFASFNHKDDDFPFGFVSGDGAGEYIISGVSGLDLTVGSKLGDRMIAKNKVKEDETVSQSVAVIDSKFNAKFLPAATEDECMGFVFGLNEKDSELNTAGGYLELHKNKITLKVFKDGAQVSDDANNTVTLGSTLIDQLTSEIGMDFQLVVSKDGKTSLYRYRDDKYVLMKAFQEPVTKYAGYCGFLALSDIAHTITVDDAMIYNSSYYIPVTKSVTHNFSNDFWGNKGFEDFYVPNNMDGNIYVLNGRLHYEFCSDNAFFGSAHQYDAFILDYKLCNVLTGPEMNSKDYTSPTKWIGLDLSRRTKTLSEYGTYGMALFEIVPKEDSAGVYLQFYKKDDSPVDREELIITRNTKPISAEMLRAVHYDNKTTFKETIPEDKFICVRWVSDGSSLSLYLKTNGETEYTWYGTIANLELNGYFALSCTGFTFLEYDDFSMANTSPIYTCADNESPEVITVTETTTIYDPGNIDVNLDEEIKLNNAGGNNTPFIIAIVALGVVVLGLGGGLVAVCIVSAKKKKKKQRMRSNL